MSSCNTMPTEGAEVGEKRKYTKREPVPREQLPKDFWLVEHVAAYLGRSQSWVHKAAASGTLVCTTRCGRLHFDPDKVVAWAKGQG